MWDSRTGRSRKVVGEGIGAGVGDRGRSRGWSGTYYQEVPYESRRVGSLSTRQYTVYALTIP